MYVLVRIDVSRILTYIAAERCELTTHLFLNSLAIIQRVALVERHPLPIAQMPFAEIEM
jgi:hypothetical protein